MASPNTLARRSQSTMMVRRYGCLWCDNTGTLERIEDTKLMTCRPCKMLRDGRPYAVEELARGIEAFQRRHHAKES